MDTFDSGDNSPTTAAVEGFAMSMLGLTADQFAELPATTRGKLMARVRRQLRQEGVFDLDYEEMQATLENRAAEADSSVSLRRIIDSEVTLHLHAPAPMAFQAPMASQSRPLPTFQSLLRTSSGRTPPSVIGSIGARRETLYPHLLVSSTDVAWLATKAADAAMGNLTNPSVITHWRKRHDEFPEPVVAGRSPRFRLSDVVDWLNDTKRLEQEPSVDWLWRHAIQLLPPLADPKQATPLRHFLVGLVASADRVVGLDPSTVHGGSDEIGAMRSESDRLVRAALDWAAADPFLELDSALSELLPVTQALRLAIDGPSSRLEVLDAGLEALSRFSTSTHETTPALTSLIADLALAEAPAGGYLLDLGCGEGRLLTTLLSHRNGGTPEFVEGWEHDPGAAGIARLRMDLMDAPARIGVRDALDPADDRYDIVCTDPPTGNTSTWLRQCLDLLRPDDASRGFILIPAAELREGRVGELFDMGGSGDPLPLEAVVLLPPGSRPHAKGLQALCVVTSPSNPQDSCMVIDLSGKRIEPHLSKQGSRGREVVTTPVLGQALHRWRQDHAIADPDDLCAETEALTGTRQALPAGLFTVVSKAEVFDRGIYRPRRTVPDEVAAAITDLDSALQGMDPPADTLGSALIGLQTAMARVIREYRIR